MNEPRDLGPEVRSGYQAMEAAVERYAAAHDRFAETEQMQHMLGNWAEAEGAHRYALICLRAWQAEAKQP